MTRASDIRRIVYDVATITRLTHPVHVSGDATRLDIALNKFIAVWKSRRDELNGTEKELFKHYIRWQDSKVTYRDVEDDEWWASLSECLAHPMQFQGLLRSCLPVKIRLEKLLELADPKRDRAAEENDEQPREAQLRHEGMQQQWISLRQEVQPLQSLFAKTTQVQTDVDADGIDMGQSKAAQEMMATALGSMKHELLATISAERQKPSGKGKDSKDGKKKGGGKGKKKEKGGWKGDKKDKPAPLRLNDPKLKEGQCPFCAEEDCKVNESSQPRCKQYSQFIEGWKSQSLAGQAATAQTKFVKEKCKARNWVKLKPLFRRFLFDAGVKADTLHEVFGKWKTPKGKGKGKGSRK